MTRKFSGRRRNASIANASNCASVGADAPRHLDLTPRDEWPRHRGSEEVLAVVDGARTERGEDEVADELLAEILDEALLGSRRKRFRTNAGKLAHALADVSGDADDARVIVLAEPGYDDGGIEAARIGEDNSTWHVYSVCAGYAIDMHN